MRGRIAIAGAFVALAAAPPALAANADVRAVDGATDPENRWDPSAVSVNVGDTVTWRFDGTTQAHNVKSTTTNWNIDTNFAVAGPPASYTFTAEGIYDFVCELHASMTGRVTVGVPPPPPPSEQHFANDQPSLTVFERPDEIRPRLRAVRAAPVRNGARVRFRLSEPARVTVRIKLAGITIKSKRRAFEGGRRSMIVRDRRLDGRYSVEVFARDLAGNRSQVKRASVRVR